MGIINIFKTDTMQIRLYILDVYFAYYSARRPFCRTNEEAYEDVETLSVKQYGIKIFETYGAFRTTKFRYENLYPETPVPQQPLLTNLGYFNRFYDLVETMSPVQAWIILERDVCEAYGTQVYSNFLTFDESRRRYIRGLPLFQNKPLLRWAFIKKTTETILP